MQKYSKKFALLHWIHAILIALVLIGGLVNLPNLPQNGTELAPFKMHMIMGFLVFILLLVRFFMVKKELKLEPIYNDKKEILVNLNHKLIYIFIALSAISGAATAKSANIGQVLIFGKEPSVYSGPGGITAILGQIHTISAYTLLALIIMHIVGVVSYAIAKDRNIIKRVWI